jgi:predicted transcriptional regulator
MAATPTLAEGSMKTLAIRLDDDVQALLALVAQLEDKPIIGVIREAIDAHLAAKRDEADLAERAETVLADIDREAAARKEAIETLFGKPEPESTARRGRGKGGAVLGFTPPNKGGSETE